MTELIERNFEEKKVRILQREDALWFVAIDVCRAMGVKQSRSALDKLDKSEVSSVHLMDAGKPRKLNLVSEPGLYTLVLRSDKPEAKRFQRWVTGEVLPSIRKTGSYCSGLPAGVLAASERRLRLMAQRYAAFVRYELRSRIMDLRGLSPDMICQLAMEAAKVKATYSGFEQAIWDNAPVSDEFVQRVAELEEKGKLGWMQCIEWR